MSFKLSVIIPAHNPRMDYLQKVLNALQAQTLPSPQWELLFVDNRSEPPLAGRIDLSWHPNAAVVREETLGLTRARVAGFQCVRGEFIVLVDDDNVPASDYLTHVVRLFAEHPRVGALGGKIFPEFEGTPHPWIKEFFGLIACRDYGDSPMVSNGLWDDTLGRNVYPRCAPVGAGMALRREAVQPWLTAPLASELTDRRGTELSSGGDNDIVLTLMKHGWDVGYFPELSLTHLIPAGRIERDYLARLNRGIAKSWIQVLRKHDASPWQPIPRWTLPLRRLKAWITHRAWVGPTEYIRWQGACGHFEGRVVTS